MIIFIGTVIVMLISGFFIRLGLRQAENPLSTLTAATHHRWLWFLGAWLPIPLLTNAFHRTDLFLAFPVGSLAPWIVSARPSESVLPLLILASYLPLLTLAIIGIRAQSQMAFWVSFGFFAALLVWSLTGWVYMVVSVL